MTTKTILLIEDDLFIAEMYSRSLGRAGYQVDVIQNGQDGLQAALAKQYGIILLDVMLPDKKGTEILKELRGAEDKVPNSRVIVLTNFEQDEESRAIMEAQADGYLIKADITPRKLIDIADSLTNEAQQPMPES